MTETPNPITLADLERERDLLRQAMAEDEAQRTGKIGVLCEVTDTRRGPRSADFRRKVSEGQRRRYAENPAALSTLKTSITDCWMTGRLASRRVQWTPEMDSVLRDMAGQYSFKRVRMEAPEVIGVGEHSVRARLKELKLQCCSAKQVLSRKVKEVETFKQKTSVNLKSTKLTYNSLNQIYKSLGLK